MKVYFSREDHIEISDPEHQRFLDRFFGFDTDKLIILSEYLFGDFICRGRCTAGNL